MEDSQEHYILLVKYICARYDISIKFVILLSSCIWIKWLEWLEWRGKSIYEEMDELETTVCDEDSDCSQHGHFNMVRALLGWSPRAESA